MTPKPFLISLVNMASCLPCCSREITGFPERFFTVMQGKSALLQFEPGRQTNKYLRLLLLKEKKLQKHLRKTHSASSVQLFGDAEKQYVALPRQMQANASSISNQLMGEAGLFYPCVFRKRFIIFHNMRYSTGPC